MPPDPPMGKGLCSPFSGHSRLLHLQWPLITKVIENPGLGCAARAAVVVRENSTSSIEYHRQPCRRVIFPQASEGN